MHVSKLTPELVADLRSQYQAVAPWKTESGESLKRAAVGIILIEADDGSGEPAFLLTLRNSKMRSHAGQYALPGGRANDGEMPIETVIRECDEEIGLKLREEQAIGSLDVYVSQSGYVITPVVFVVLSDAAFNINPEEVTEMFRIKLSDVTGERGAQFSDELGGGANLIRLPLFDHHLHAPTAAMIYQLLELLAGRYTAVSHLVAPDFATR
ncbi:8-oxo-dGTP pyrophosphatase MutT (NUDIX family) [Mesorhizobium robiniae]|uniref:8-oxo-dGTP pyrophosphatase MutT (NUDIX family) n=1 Tax=Mesorhizobium robiniae TaxID=559315 RepID=A0ABV2GYS2_9HYPH|nr:CoA pyrophosphatase [Mesorhizobium sp. ZC-5]MCV3243956.1 CoA pyrophosphatase [Mesorhizobium sp. ZC-5]